MGTRAEAVAFLRRQGRGEEDHYFHAIDLSRQRFAVHQQRELEGRDLMGWRAQDGSLPFRDVCAMGAAGGGLVRYRWQRPSSGQEEGKLGYVLPVPKWGWVIGSGRYLAAQAAQATAETPGGSAGVGDS